MQLASLADGRYEQDFVMDSAFFKNMDNADILSADINVHLDMVKKHEAYDCTFHCTGSLQVPCDRCLDPLTLDVDTTYHIIVRHGDNYDDATDDVLVIPYSDTYLNVAYLLYDTILLTIPLRHVHPQGKCNKAMVAMLNRHSSSTADEEAAEALEEIDANPDDGEDI